MSTTLEINGRELYPIKEAAALVSYSRDYITRLAREQKVVATHLGRKWYVDIDSLKSYAESASLEQELRKQRLSEERKLEQKTKVAVRQKNEIRARQEKNLHFKAITATVCILCTGLLSGWLTFQLGTNSKPVIDQQVANTLKVSETEPEGDLFGQVDYDGQSAKLAFPLFSATATAPTSSIKRIADNVENGVLLFPHGSLTASPTEMFSDEVMVFTADNGTQAVVRVDETGRPVGEVVPFVLVPVSNNSDYSDR